MKNGLFSNHAALSNMKISLGVNVRKRTMVSGYIMQITMEKAAKEYIRSFVHDPELEVEACGLIREYKKESVDAYELYEEEGIVAAIKKYNRGKKNLVKKLEDVKSRGNLERICAKRRVHK